MNKFILYSIIVILVMGYIGCSQEDLTIQERIVGNWKLIEIFSDPGDGSGEWKSVEDGYNYNFMSNNQFTSTRFTECDFGTYTVNSDESTLTLDFGCTDFTLGIETPEGTFVEQFSFKSKDLILNPTYVVCIEGCGWKFRKIK